eukprot:g3100.t1
MTSVLTEDQGISSSSSAANVSEVESSTYHDVSFTAIDALLCKASSVNQGYYTDPFIKTFAYHYFYRKREQKKTTVKENEKEAHGYLEPKIQGKPSFHPRDGRSLPRRSPLMNRGYFARVHCIDSIIGIFLKRYENQGVQVVNLGAGLDSTFFRLSNKSIRQTSSLDSSSTLAYLSESSSQSSSRSPSPDLCETFRRVIKGYYEIDIPELLQIKREIIKHHSFKSRLSDFLWDGYTDEQTGPYHLIPGNLCELAELQQRLQEANFSPNIPTLFISECVLCYMDIDDANRVIEWCGNELVKTHCQFISYEQLNCNDAFGKHMLTNLQRKGCALRTVEKYPTKESLRARYHSLGWDSNVDIKTLNECYHFYVEKRTGNKTVQKKADGVDADTYSSSTSLSQRIAKLEIFDEFEEWFLINHHYAITVATREVKDVSHIDNRG